MTERDFATEVVRTLQSAGHQAVFAGGCVRDQLLGLEPHDYDVATDAPPEVVQGYFRRTVAVGVQFGVVEVLGPQKHKVQVATFRSDGVYVDGRRPENVKYSTAKDDAERRDFTINGMFYDPISNTLLDYVGGQADLDAKILRAIGDAASRFREDKLRLLRAVRMAARFGLQIEPQTRNAIREMAAQLSVVSAERIADEMRKMLKDRNREKALQMLWDTGLVTMTLPEAKTLEFVGTLPGTASFELALASVLDSVNDAKRVASRWKLSRDEGQRIAWLVAHRTAIAEPLKPSRIYPILAHPASRELLTLSRALGQPETAVVACETLLVTVDVNPPPLLTGDELVARGWTPGKVFKDVLQRVRDAQLDGELHDFQSAYAMAEQLRQSLI